MVTEEQNLKKILAGRIDVYQTSKAVGWTMSTNCSARRKPKKLPPIPSPMRFRIFFILFTKTPKGKALADKFDSGFAKLKKSGAYDKIMTR